MKQGSVERGSDEVVDGQMPTTNLKYQVLTDCRKYQLMERAVLPVSGSVPFVQDGVRYVELAHQISCNIDPLHICRNAANLGNRTIRFFFTGE